MTDELPRTELLRTESLSRHFKIGSALSRRTLPTNRSAMRLAMPPINKAHVTVRGVKRYVLI